MVRFGDSKKALNERKALLNAMLFYIDKNLDFLRMFMTSFKPVFTPFLRSGLFLHPLFAFFLFCEAGFCIMELIDNRMCN